MTGHADGGCLLPGRIRLFERSIEFKAVAFQLVFSPTFLILYECKV
jgi:hypothetical protein